MGKSIEKTTLTSVLDVKDRRILAELDLNARATFHDLGKSAGLSKEVAIYRVNQLEERGIIERYTTLVDFAKLGYAGFAIYSRFQNVNDETKPQSGLGTTVTKKEIISFLSEIPELYWIALVGGRFDIVCGMMCKNIVQFNRIYYSIITKYGKHLVDNTISIRTELRQNRRTYLLEKNGANKNKESELFIPPFFGREPDIEKIDVLDEKILSLLSNDARLPIIELAKSLGKPASTISLRLKRLKDRGIIQGYTAYIRSQKFGMQSYRLLLSLENMDESERKKLFSYVNQNPKMILAIETVGEWNFEMTLEVESHEELQREITSLRNNFSSIIRNIDFLIMFEDDLVYDPYPLKKHERKMLHENSPEKRIKMTDSENEK